MSNRPYDVSVDATDGDEIVTPRPPDHAEDIAHNKTSVAGSYHGEEENLDDEIIQDHQDSPHNLEREFKKYEFQEFLSSSI